MLALVPRLENPTLRRASQRALRIFSTRSLRGIKVLCTVDVFNEGGRPAICRILLFLRPIESKRIFYQQLGRGLRQYAGKSHCTVIDFIGNFHNAYRIVEYQSLLPFEDSDLVPDLRHARNRKEILNLPLNCEVHFDEKVVKIFADQALNPRYATRQHREDSPLRIRQTSAAPQTRSLETRRRSILHSE